LICVFEWVSQIGVEERVYRGDEEGFLANGGKRGVKGNLPEKIFWHFIPFFFSIEEGIGKLLELLSIGLQFIRSMFRTGKSVV
jgi:hypothetical protein